MAVSLDGKAAAVYRALGNLNEKKKQWDTAYGYYRKAFEQDKTNVESLESLYRIGSEIQHWEDMRDVFEDFLSYRPGYVPAMKRLSSIYRALGSDQKARHLAEQAAVFDHYNPGFREFCTTM